MAHLERILGVGRCYFAFVLPLVVSRVVLGHHEALDLLLQRITLVLVYVTPLLPNSAFGVLHFLVDLRQGRIVVWVKLAPEELVEADEVDQLAFYGFLKFSELFALGERLLLPDCIDDLVELLLHLHG